MCFLCTSWLKISPAKKTKKNGDKSASGKIERCTTSGLRISGHRAAEVFIDFTEKHKSLETNSTCAIHKNCVASGKHSREAKVRRSEKFKSKFLISAGPHALKFEYRSQEEETERQERCARRRRVEAGQKCVKKLKEKNRATKNILTLKKKDKATFFLPIEVWCLPAPSVIKPEEREFVVDFGASMHMLNKKDLNSAELETVRVSESPTTVVAANGEVQANKEATVYVKELGLFATVNSAKITCDTFTCASRVMCYCVISASAYTSAGPLSLKQNGVFTQVITSGYTDSHTAHSTHIGSGARLLLILIHELRLIRAVQ